MQMQQHQVTFELVNLSSIYATLTPPDRVMMSGPVHEFFRTPVPEKVWHYTTLAGLEGILSSGTVWATEAHFTTDTAEFVHARDVATAYLERAVPTDKATELAKKTCLESVTYAFEQGSLSQARTEVFVASFSAAKDLKSQWVEYADKGHGVSIAFDLRGIRPPADSEYAITFAPCIYTDTDKERLLDSALSHLFREIVSIYRETGDLVWTETQLDDWRLVDQIYGVPFDQAALNQEMTRRIGERLRRAQVYSVFDMLRLASHCKDHSFRQEEEWRLALPHTKDQPLEHIQILLRGVRGNIPFVAHNLFQTPLRITEIMLGPLCTSSAEITQLLERYDHDVPVAKSSIPMRDPAGI